MPRKEWHESWAVAGRVAELLPAAALRGRVLVDCAGGHALAGQLCLVRAPDGEQLDAALCADVRVPKYAAEVHRVLAQLAPERLAGRVRMATGTRLERLQRHAYALLLGVHACGPLTDAVLDMALEWRVPVCVLPCCHDKRRCDDGGRAEALGGPLAIDLERALRLRRAGFEVRLSTIPGDITPQNRLIAAWPSEMQQQQEESAREEQSQQRQQRTPQNGTRDALPPMALAESPWRRYSRRA